MASKFSKPKKGTDEVPKVEGEVNEYEKLKKHTERPKVKE